MGAIAAYNVMQCIAHTVSEVPIALARQGRSMYASYKSFALQHSRRLSAERHFPGPDHARLR